MTRISIMILLAAAVAGCRSEATGQKAGGSEQTRGTEESTLARTGASGPTASALKIGELATCQPAAEVNSMVRRVIELADTDGNGQVSREEARGGMSFLLGGAFFRADENADGRITPEEGRKMRADLERQHPGMGALLRQVRESTGKRPFQALAQVLNVDYGKPLTMDEARAAARSAMDDLFRVADTNNDDMISRQEAATASWEGVRALGRQAFAAADANQDGHLSASEFEEAMSGSAKAVFSVADTDNDGRLTENEAASAMSAAMHQLNVRPAEPNR
jgi:Ca2+-binding EF-hand superfamily protein